MKSDVNSMVMVVVVMVVVVMVVVVMVVVVMVVLVMVVVVLVALVVRQYSLFNTLNIGDNFIFNSFVLNNY
jgi:hypothetical protein